MAKNKDRSRKPAGSGTKPAADEAESPKDDGKPEQKLKRDGYRETVESIVVAFVLAIGFRTFAAEAFVIPTGSMSPTLYGRHKEVHCPKCGTHFTVGASEEVRVPPYPDGTYFNPLARIHTSFCPNCRYEIDIEDDLPFTGDRILVNKWPYEFGEPQRWDVVVFKFPEDPKTNYIKRLVGLPGEELRIERGDVYRRTDDGWEILRKDDPNKQRRLQIPVYDDDHPPTELIEAGWPERWGPVAATDEAETRWDDDPNGWQPDRKARSYRVDAGAETAWLRYRHFLPTPGDWDAVPNVDTNPPPQLVTDFLAYNTYTGGQPGETILVADDEREYWTGYWCGDLTLNCRVRVERAEGELVFELNRGARRYRCTIDVSTGTASLAHLEDGLNLDAPVLVPMATGPTRIKSAGTYRVSFANVDRRLVLWVDDAIVPFDGETTYGPPSLPGPFERDVTPVGIAARGTAVTVDRLRIQRDVYYRAEEYTVNGQRGTAEVGFHSFRELATLRSDPAAWAEEYDGLGHRHRPPYVQFERLGDDEFFMLGDNSARSQDSRLWDNGGNPLLARERRHSVPRSALVGKAFFVYWPHGVPFLNGGRGYSGFAKPIPRLNQWFYHATPPMADQNGNLVERAKITDYPRLSFPFYPQVSRMKRIR